MTLLDLIGTDVKLAKVSGAGGGEWHGPCPFCGGKDRFRVQLNHSGTDRWACRRCEKNGDIYAYLKERRGMTFPEAKEYLGEVLPAQTTPQNPSQKTRFVWMTFAADFVKNCEAQLWTDKGKKALDYLHARGLKDETIKMMRLGYNKTDYQPVGNNKAIMGITIPWVTGADVIGVNIRRLKPKDSQDRYKAVGESRKTLYYLPGDPRTLCVCEGEFDAGLVLQELAMSAVAIGSAQQISKQLRGLVTQFDRVVLIPDADEPGQAMAKKWQAQFPDVLVFRLPTGVHDVTDFVVGGGDLDQWFRKQEDTAAKVEKPTATTSKKDEKPEHVVDKTALFRLAKKRYVVFHDQFGETYAEFQQTTHAEIAPVRSAVVRADLGKLFLQHTTDRPVGRSTVVDVRDALEAIAEGQRTLHCRAMTEAESRTVRYDLVNDKWQTVTIRPSGWEFQIMEHPIFKRYKHQRQQCNPERGGHIDELWQFLPSLGDAETEAKHRLLVLAFLVGGIVLTERPAFALVLNGTEGSGKSSAAWALRELIDPSVSPSCRDIYDLGKLTHYLCHNRVVILDNLTYIRVNLSDLISSAITGAGETKRKLHTDDDDIVRVFQPVFILNGIDNIVRQPDLLDRCLSIHLERLTQPEDEQAFRDGFMAAKPRIFGALLDIIGKAIGIYPDVKLTERYRMADAARWGIAVTRALGHDDAEFYEAYRSNASDNLDDIVEGNILASTILNFLNQLFNHEFKGSPTELYQVLTRHADFDPQRPPKSWPIDAARLVKNIKALQRPLENANVYCRQIHSKQRMIHLWCKQEPEQEPDWVNNDGNDVGNDGSDVGKKALPSRQTVATRPQGH